MLGRRQRAPAGEDAELREHRSLLVVEQPVAPVQRGAHRSVAIGRVARRGTEARQHAVEPERDLLRRLGAGARGGQLDRQRQTTDARAHRGDRLGVLRGHAKRRVARAGAGDEQRRRGRRGHGRRMARAGQRERAHAIAVLGAQIERRPARREQLEPRRGVQQLGEQRRRREQLLEVVEDQQLLGAGGDTTERVGGAHPRLRRARQRMQHRVGDGLRIGERREVDERGAVGELRCQPVGDLDRKRRLADTARPEDGDQPHVVATQQFDQRPRVVRATEDVGPPRRQSRRRRRARARRARARRAPRAGDRVELQ